MSHQSLLPNAIRLISALALLVSVMASPIRPAPTASGGSHPDCLRRNFGIPGKAANHHRPHVPATSRVVQVKALSSQTKLDWTTPPARHGADPACPPSSLAAGRYASAPGSDRAIHPLRC